MEYLMTYGWAILIVIIVAAALFALGVFNPATYTGRAATGFGGLGTPADWQYTGTSLSMMLTNQAGVSVTVTAVNSTGCTGGFSGSTPIASGSTAEFTVTGCPSKNAGDSYSQAVVINFTRSGSVYPSMASGTVTGTAV